MAAAAMIFAGCSKDDGSVKIIDNLAEKIIGKWLVADVDGQAAPTNEKAVLSFPSATKAYISTSRTNYSEEIAYWLNNREFDVEISGNKLTLTGHINDRVTLVHEFVVTAIDDVQMSANYKRTRIVNGETEITSEQNVRFEKVTVDYSDAIHGMWEGRSTGAQGSEFDDGENHRWEYLLDGTFNYFHKVGGVWQISDDEFAQYFVDGNLLCTRWKNTGENTIEHREWWEISSIENNTMNWTALRQREDGTTYTATFQMTKVPANK